MLNQFEIYRATNPITRKEFMATVARHADMCNAIGTQGQCERLSRAFRWTASEAARTAIYRKGAMYWVHCGEEVWRMNARGNASPRLVGFGSEFVERFFERFSAL